MAAADLSLARLLRHCPRCGHQPFSREGAHGFRCPACDFRYFLNPATAAAAFLVDDQDRLLLIVRAREPARGRLALPGGFVDAGESAERGLRRELQEELGLRVRALRYLSSHPNRYHYRGVIYPVLDLYFTGRAASFAPAVDRAEVESYRFLSPADVDPADLAFPSMRRAFRDFLRDRTRDPSI